MRRATSRSLREWLSICTSSSNRFLMRSWLIILPPKVQVRAILLHQDASERGLFACQVSKGFDIRIPAPFGRGQGEGVAQNRKRKPSRVTTLRSTKEVETIGFESSLTPHPNPLPKGGGGSAHHSS